MSLVPFSLPQEVKTPGVRPMEERDIEDVRCMLNRYLEKFKFGPIYTTEVSPHLSFCVPCG